MPYSDKVNDHFTNPRNVGSLDKNAPNVGTGIVGAPECGDVMKLQILCDEDDRIIDAKFKTFGCGSAIASSSLATEWIKGKKTQEALQIKNVQIAKELSLRGLPPSLRVPPRPRVVVPIAGVHRGIAEAINFARSISDDVTAVYVELEPGSGQQVRERWDRWWPSVPLVVVPSPYRSIVGPLLDFLDETDSQHNDGQLAAVVLPEFIPATWWQNILHAQTAWVIRTALLYRRRHLGFQRTIIDVPFHLRR